MAKPELGTKRLCASCGAKFYDLNKSPIVCPTCDTVFEIVQVVPRGRPDAAKAAPRETVVEAPETQDAEFVSLEEADAEAQGKKKPADAEAVTDDDLEVEVEDAEEGDDAAFIEEAEEEDTDVSEIIGGDIEDEEET